MLSSFRESLAGAALPPAKGSLLHSHLLIVLAGYGCSTIHILLFPHALAHDQAEHVGARLLQVTMRELQGGIIGSSLFIIFLGISGLLTAVLHFISPITGEHRCLSSPWHR